MISVGSLSVMMMMIVMIVILCDVVFVCKNVVCDVDVDVR